MKPRYFDEDEERARLIAELEAQGLELAVTDPTVLAQLGVLFEERPQPRGRGTGRTHKHTNAGVAAPASVAR